MTEFGARFEDIESGFLLIARAQDDDTINWECVADVVTADALSRRYLPETCRSAKDDEDEGGGIAKAKNWRKSKGDGHLITISGIYPTTLAARQSVTRSDR
jgi:hypothetical protein